MTCRTHCEHYHTKLSQKSLCLAVAVMLLCSDTLSGRTTKTTSETRIINIILDDPRWFLKPLKPLNPEIAGVYTTCTSRRKSHSDPEVGPCFGRLVAKISQRPLATLPWGSPGSRPATPRQKQSIARANSEDTMRTSVVGPRTHVDRAHTKRNRPHSKPKCRQELHPTCSTKSGPISAMQPCRSIFSYTQFKLMGG